MEEHKENKCRVYGQWAGNPKGVKEDETRCVVEVPNGMLFTQCQRKRGYGKDKLYCKQHGKMKEID